MSNTEASMKVNYLLWLEREGVIDALDGHGYVIVSADEIERLREARRWNIELDGDDLLVCFEDHDKGEKCEYIRFRRV